MDELDKVIKESERLVADEKLWNRLQAGNSRDTDSRKDKGEDYSSESKRVFPFRQVLALAACGILAAGLAAFSLSHLKVTPQVLIDYAGFDESTHDWLAYQVVGYYTELGNEESAINAGAEDWMDTWSPWLEAEPEVAVATE